MSIFAIQMVAAVLVVIFGGILWYRIGRRRVKAGKKLA
jgi:hypothetical protein